MARSRGPRGGNSDTRADIVSAAAAVFLERGYEKASFRAIARAARVDPALVHHYFSSKPELFIAALRPVQPGDDRLVSLGTGDPLTLGERLVRAFVSLWDDPEWGARLRVVLASSVSNPDVAQATQRLLVGEVLAGVTAAAPGPEAPFRAAACASQLMGLALGRYVIRVEPLATASEEQLVALFAPTLQRYITGTVDVS